ncbi:MAG: spore protease YyaC [Clostridiales bacterium]|nr:spore protease YyaC [Clostridiales bacterium]
MQNKSEQIYTDIGLRTPYSDKKSIHTLSKYISKFLNKKTIILCIGTDKCIGDCLGPLVGTLLTKSNFVYPVIGTLDNPAHAINLENVVSGIEQKYRNPFIIAIDACLGSSDFIGDIQVKLGPVHPGKGVGKTLPFVGDISIVGIVDSVDVSDIFSIRSIRLNLVLKMAETISSSLIEAAKSQKTFMSEHI